MTTNELWQAVLGELELAVSKPNFNAWFKNTFIAQVENGEAVICVPNTFTRAWLEKKFHNSIIKSLSRVTAGSVKKICYRVEIRAAIPTNIPVSAVLSAKLGEQRRPGAGGAEAGAAVKTRQSEKSGQDHQGLNPRYTFENYIVGKANELAHAAGAAVAQRPGHAYNPLFIYGGVGLGKTHLLQAIGHEIVRRNSRARCLYVTCERFTNDFINAVRSGRGKEFKDTYRNVDLLLIDDIQFITGKEGTQEEFFHTFNALHQANKQIVISSDRPPKAIPALEHRLLSRFEWGMLADISSPDHEMRAAILEAKAREQGFPMPHEALHLIAESISSNIRELEGALVKIIAYHQFKKLSPSIETVRPLLTNYGKSASRASLTPKRLILTVAQYFDIGLDDILGKSREKRLAFPRQIIMYLMREELKSSYPAIGQELGGRDHTTAMHAYMKISNELQTNDRLRQDIETLKQRLSAPL